MVLKAVGKRGNCCCNDEDEEPKTYDCVNGVCVEANGQNGFYSELGNCQQNCVTGTGNIDCDETTDSATGITTRNCIGVGENQGSYATIQSCQSAGCDFPVWQCQSQNNPNGGSIIRECVETGRSSDDTEANQNCTSGTVRGNPVYCCCCNQIKTANLRSNNLIFTQGPNGPPRDNHGSSGDTITMVSPYGTGFATLTITNFGTCLSHGDVINGTFSVTATGSTEINRVVAGFGSGLLQPTGSYDSGLLPQGTKFHSGSVSATVDLSGKCFNPATSEEYEVNDANGSYWDTPSLLGMSVSAATIGQLSMGASAWAGFDCCECVSGTGGPGTNFQQMIGEIGSQLICDCNSTRSKMDRNGSEWCRANVDLLTEEVATNAAKLGHEVTTTAKVGISLMLLASCRMSERKKPSLIQRFAIVRANKQIQRKKGSLVEENNTMPNVRPTDHQS